MFLIPSQIHLCLIPHKQWSPTLNICYKQIHFTEGNLDDSLVSQLMIHLPCIFWHQCIHMFNTESTKERWIHMTDTTGERREWEEWKKATRLHSLSVKISDSVKNCRICTNYWSQSWQDSIETLRSFSFKHIKIKMSGKESNLCPSTWNSLCNCSNYDSVCVCVHICLGSCWIYEIHTQSICCVDLLMYL